MNILITNIILANYSGTEVYVRDLAVALSNRGNHVEVYSPELGRVADEIRNSGIHITDSIQEVITKPDLIHAHHFIPTMDAIVRFPEVPVIFFLHDRRNLSDTPPKYGSIMKYVAVDYNCLDRLIIDNGIPEHSTTVLYNWVDTSRFKFRETFHDKPKKALVFSNSASPSNYFRTIQETCSRLGILADGIGLNLKNPTSHPEQVLNDYDIVFAKAKAAMEALSTGAGVIVCDILGLGGMVSVDNFDYFRKFNFGMKTLTRPIDPELIIREIEKYNSEENKATGQMIRKDADMGLYVDKLLILYNKAIDEYFQTRIQKIYFNDERTIQEYLFQKNKIFRLKMNEINARCLEMKEEVSRQKTNIDQLIDCVHDYENSWSFKLGRLFLEPARMLIKILKSMKNAFNLITVIQVCLVLTFTF